MSWRRLVSTSLFHRLWIACAILVGLVLDVMPTPTPGFKTSELSSSETCPPLQPRPDDTERDETPDEVSELTWPQVKLVARNGDVRPRSVTSASCGVLLVGTGWVDARLGACGPGILTFGMESTSPC